MFSENKMIGYSRKNVQNIDRARIEKVLHNFLTGIISSDEFLVWFDRDKTKPQKELTNKLPIEGDYHDRLSKEGVFGNVEHQESAIYAWG